MDLIFRWGLSVFEEFLIREVVVHAGFVKHLLEFSTRGLVVQVLHTLDWLALHEYNRQLLYLTYIFDGISPLVFVMIRVEVHMREVDLPALHMPLRFNARMMLRVIEDDDLVVFDHILYHSHASGSDVSLSFGFIDITLQLATFVPVDLLLWWWCVSIGPNTPIRHRLVLLMLIKSNIPRTRKPRTRLRKLVLHRLFGKPNFLLWLLVVLRHLGLVLGRGVGIPVFGVEGGWLSVLHWVLLWIIYPFAFSFLEAWLVVVKDCGLYFALGGNLGIVLLRFTFFGFNITHFIDLALNLLLRQLPHLLDRNRGIILINLLILHQIGDVLLLLQPALVLIVAVIIIVLRLSSLIFLVLVFIIWWLVASLAAILS